MNKLVFIIKDKVNEILKERRTNFAGIEWEIENRDIIEIFKNESDIWNRKEPVYSIKVIDATSENPEFDREYEKFMLYKPNSDIFEEFHIAFILHKETEEEDGISMKIVKN